MSFMSFTDFSEEKMAAFIDGMLSPDEMRAFQDEINSNPVMKGILAEIQEDIDEFGITAMDDYPTFHPEETLGQIIPLVENPLNGDDSVVSPMDDMIIPPPLFDDDLILGGRDGVVITQVNPGELDGGSFLATDNDNGFLD